MNTIIGQKLFIELWSESSVLAMGTENAQGATGQGRGN